MLPSIIVYAGLLLPSTVSAAVLPRESTHCGVQPHYCTTLPLRYCHCEPEFRPLCRWHCSGPQLPPTSPAYGIDTSSLGGLDAASLEAWEAALAEFELALDAII